MDKMKKQIHQRLVANVLMDKCTQREHVVFRDAWCSQERVIRFTTVFFRNLFPVVNDIDGKWKTGDEVMYEVENGGDHLRIDCIYAPVGAAMMPVGVIRSWDIADADSNALFEDFDAFLDAAIPQFEEELEDSFCTQYLEGAKQTFVSEKYERNPKARTACLAYYGYSCKLCGMSFEKTYGPEFKNIIEVHHIVPLNEIGKQYIVDPIKDLIPVCPNCHAALHSKHGASLLGKI